MNEFDELRWVHNIQKLLLERLIEKTDEHIRSHIKEIRRWYGCNAEAAFEWWEDQLLAVPPNDRRETW